MAIRKQGNIFNNITGASPVNEDPTFILRRTAMTKRTDPRPSGSMFSSAKASGDTTSTYGDRAVYKGADNYQDPTPSDPINYGPER